MTTSDLHVVSLHYSIRSSEQVTYVNQPPTVEFETDDVRFHLAAGKLTCTMKTHFSKVEDALAAVEPVLRAWEVDADLRRNRGELRFGFNGADIIDRSADPSGVIVSPAPAPMGACSVGNVSIHVTQGEYPPPPSSSFRLNSEAQTMLDRYYRYLDQRESLQQTAFYCLTVLESGHLWKKRQSAAHKYRIDKPVLDKVGELSSEHGDPLTARKASATKPLTGPQSAWLEAVVKKLILQLGTSETARSWITMSDLPPLR